jgi:hypothetical protein
MSVFDRILILSLFCVCPFLWYPYNILLCTAPHTFRFNDCSEPLAPARGVGIASHDHFFLHTNRTTPNIASNPRSPPPTKSQVRTRRTDHTFKNHFLFHMNHTTPNMTVIKQMAQSSEAFKGLARGANRVVYRYR